MNDSILVGSASCTYPTLIACGRFYPPSCKTAEDRLRFYATQFPLVEVDSSYDAVPTPQVARLWAERTPAGFTFNVKAFRLFTGHQTEPRVLHRDLQQALGKVGRLAVVRLHGRNKETWNKKGLAASSIRFDYRYGLRVKAR